MSELEKSEIAAVIELLHVIREENKTDHADIKTRQDVTNGRVNKLESETAVFRWVFRNPKLSILLIVLIITGAFFLGTVFGFEKLLF